MAGCQVGFTKIIKKTLLRVVDKCAARCFTRSMKVQDLIKYFGSTTAITAALGVSRAAVSQWRKVGIPALRQYQIEALTKGKLRAKPVKKKPK